MPGRDAGRIGDRINTSSLRCSGISAQAAGIDAFAVDVTGYSISLQLAPIGRIGHDDARLVFLLDKCAVWLQDAAVEARLGAKLFYQLASQRLAQLCSRTARLIEIRNPLCGATLAADAQQAGDAVTQLLANAAHRQVSYLAFAAAIPEWCDFRIYQLSSTLAADCLVAEEPPKAPSPHFGADGSAASLRPIT